MSGVPDYPLEETLDFKFTTRSFSTGAPTTLAGTPVIQVYEDNSTTQINSGITLTIDFDSVTGLNNVRIVATTANGYESGKSYQAVITTGTVGGVSVVGEVVAQFSIERSPALRPTTAGRTLDVATTGEAGVDLGNVTGTLTQANVGWVDVNSRVDIGSWLGTAVTLSLSSKPEVDVFSVSSSSAAADTLESQISLLDASIATSIGDVPADVWTYVGTRSLTQFTFSVDLNSDQSGATIGTVNTLAWQSSWDAEVQSEVNDALVALNLDHLLAVAATGADVADNCALAKLVSSSPTADWDDFVNTTDSLQALRDHIGDGSNLTEAGGTGNHLTDLGGMSTAMKAEVNAECDTSMTDYDGVVPADLPANFGSLVISGAGAVDSLLQGFLNNTISETTADNIAANFETFWDNANALTAKTVDDVGSGGGDATAANQTTIINHLTDVKGTGFAKDTHSLTDIQADTNELQTDDVPGLIAALNDVSAADVNLQVDTALSDFWTSPAALVDLVWDEDVDLAHQTAGSAGKKLDDVATSSALATAQSDLDTLTGTDGVTLATSQPNYAPNTTIPDAAGTAAGLHATTDAAITALNDLSSADVSAAVWNAATATYGSAGSYGLLVETNLDAQVSAAGGLDASGVRAAVGLASANLDTQLSAIDTVVDGIQSDLDNGTDGLGALKALLDGVPGALLDLTDGIETNITPRQALRAIAAKSAGLISGAGSGTEIVKGIGQSAGGTTRGTALVDGSGNISGWTLNL